MSNARRVLPSLRGADVSVRGCIESTTSFGLFVKFLLLEVTLFYCLSYIDGIEEHLGITPGNLIPSFKVWTLFTYALIDIHWWNLIRNWVFICLAGKFVQPLWGDLELLLFYLITNTFSGLWTTFMFLLSFMTVGNEEFLFETKICGLSAFIGGVFIAFKQLLPEEVISSLPFLHIRVKHLPFTAFALCLTMTLLKISGVPTLLLFTNGMLVSWIYLRFYQLHTTIRGDLSDGFTFASFFPEVAQPAVAILANTIHAGLVRMGVCRKMVRRYDVGASSSGAGGAASLTLQMNPAERADQQRRRDLALKALTVRLGQGSPAVGTSSSNPDMTSATGGNSLQSSTSAPGDSGSGTGAEWPALGGGSGIGSSKNSGTGATQLSSVVVDPGN
ncbi:transmembrane protein 115-like [Convolutriloba macropyga]|uniref:transmembrane protein 115-like n=1 Tax=Convolutriloba macropyga TaxID=536237 RepID=UPI003F526DCF